MTGVEEKELFRMVKEIYHHLNLDGTPPISINSIREQAAQDVLKFKEKKRIKGHELEARQR